MGKIPIIVCKIGQKTSEKVILSTAFHKFVGVANFTLARLGKERLVEVTHFTNQHLCGLTALHSVARLNLPEY